MSLIHILTAAVLPALALAAPVETVDEAHLEGRQCTGCPPIIAPHAGWCAKIDSEEIFSRAPWQVGLSVASGATPQYSTARTWESSWNIGGEIGVTFEDIVGISATGGYSTSIGGAMTLGVEHGCPENFKGRCSFLISDTYVRVKGHMVELSQGESCPSGIKGKGGDFEAEMPKKDQAGNAAWAPDLCNCCNLPGKDGGPERCCIEDCATVPSRARV